MKRINLTIERIKKAKLINGKETFLRDNEQTGLAVRIVPSPHHPDGLKTYVFQYRWQEKPYKKKINHVNAISLQQARDIARDYAYQISEAEKVKALIDPLKDTGEPLPSFYEIAKEYLEYRKRNHPNQTKAAATTIRDWVYMVGYLKKNKIGKMPIQEVKTRDAKEFFDTFSDRTTHGNRVKSFYTLVFQYAIGTKGYRDGDNVWIHIRNYKEHPQRPRLIEDKDNPKEDQPTLFLKYMKEAIEGKQRDKKGFAVDPAWIGMMLLNYFTGARPAELQNLKISDIDKKRDKIYKKETKTGEKIILLNKRAQQVIEWGIKNIRRVKDNPYLFAGKYGRGYRATWRGKPWNNLKEATGITAPPYALRRSFATQAKRQQEGKEGGDIEVVTGIMGHANKTMTELYAGKLPEELRKREELLERENEVLGDILARDFDFPGTAQETTEV